MESTPLQKEIGSRLRKIRLSMDLSQNSISKILGMSTSGYTAMELGNTNITTERVYQLCAVFKCEVTDILPPAKEFKPHLKYVKVLHKSHPTHKI
jgi:transcriptional regulator with XRE-family HTH domain